jgi:hypothetical protein
MAAAVFADGFAMSKARRFMSTPSRAQPCVSYRHLLCIYADSQHVFIILCHHAKGCSLLAFRRNYTAEQDVFIILRRSRFFMCVFRIKDNFTLNTDSITP